MRFRHKFIHDCALRLLPVKHFQIANKVAAGLIAKRNSKSDSIAEHHYHELARLYRNCGNLENARLNYILAGNAAMKHGATRDAGRMYFQLIELSLHLDRKRLPLHGFHNLQHENSHLHFMLGLTVNEDWIKKLCFEKALKILGNIVQPQTSILHKFSLMKARISSKLNPPDERAKRAVTTTKQANENVLKAKIWQQLAILYVQEPKMYMYCNYMQVYHGCKAGVTDELLVGMADLATSFTSLGKFKEAEKYLAKIEPIVDVLDSPWSRSCYNFARANLLCTSGNIMDSLALYEECSIGFLQQCGAFSRWYATEAERLMAMTQVGQLNEAIGLCKEDLRQCEDIAEESWKRRFSNLLLLLYARSGAFKSAIDCYVALEEGEEGEKQVGKSGVASTSEMFSRGKSSLSVTIKEGLSGTFGRDKLTVIGKKSSIDSMGSSSAAYCMQTEDGTDANSAVIKVLNGALPSSAYWWHFETAYWGCCTAIESYSKAMTLKETEKATNTGGSDLVKDDSPGMKKVVKKWMKKLKSFKLFPICMPWILIVDARMGILQETNEKSILSTLEHAHNLASTCGNAYAVAVCDIEIAQIGRSASMSTRINRCKHSMASFESIGASFEYEKSVLALVRLDPLSPEFRRMADKVGSSRERRRSSLSHQRASIGPGRVSAIGMEIHLNEMIVGTETPLVGRKDEFTLIMKAANGFRTKVGRCISPILIEAAAGMGKTALVKSIYSDLSKTMSSYFKILRSDGSDLESANPFYVFKRIFSDLLLIKSRDNDNMAMHISRKGNHGKLGQHSRDEVAAERQDKEHLISQVIECVGGDECERSLALMNSVLNWNYPETEFTRDLKGETRSSHTIDFLQDVLEGYARKHKRLVVIIENIHWLDTMR